MLGCSVYYVFRFARCEGLLHSSAYLKPRVRRCRPNRPQLTPSSLSSNVIEMPSYDFRLA